MSIPDAVIAIIQAFSEWAIALPDFVTNLVNAVLGWVTELPDMLLDIINTIIDWFTNDETGLIVTIIHALLSWIAEIPDLITTIFNAFVDWLVLVPTLAVNIISAVLQIISEATGDRHCDHSGFHHLDNGDTGACFRPH